MSDRFFVGTVSGWLAPVTSHHMRLPHITAIVFDRDYNCRNLASYRFEDELGAHTTQQEAIGRALQKAHEHARRLNAQEATHGVVV